MGSRTAPGGLNVSWAGIRRLVCFLLGIALILDYLASQYGSTAELIAGLILVGILPLDSFRRVR